MDEKDGYLRVATTTTANWRDHIGNNIYVLDGEMKIIGRLEGLEKGERIYAVRFMGEKAYIVTYRETDPLFVVDLSDPRNPRVEGILKIPGYSTYLHPIGDGKMVGVGKDDDGKVKISLFDVSDPENPKELDVYHIDAWWSEAIRNHHAFLWDPKAEIVALPVGTKYYVLGAGDNEFRAERVVDMNSPARRAAYVNNYLYLFGDGSVVVVDEGNFDIVARKKIDQWNYVFPEPRPLPVEPV
jgi:inhibitor of cysteine peptidase